MSYVALSVVYNVDVTNKDADKTGKSMQKVTTVDEYIASMPRESQDMLVKLRDIIKRAAPEAVERLSYGMPFYEYGGSGFKGRLIYFSLSGNHISIYIPPSLDGRHMQQWEKYKSTKSAFHIPLDESFPDTLISDTVEALVIQRDKQNKK